MYNYYYFSIFGFPFNFCLLIVSQIIKPVYFLHSVFQTTWQRTKTKCPVRQGKIPFYKNLFYWNLLKMSTWFSQLHPVQWQGVLNSSGDWEDFMLVLYSTYTDKLTLFLGSTVSTFRKYHHHYPQVLFLGTGKIYKFKPDSYATDSSQR